MFLPLISADVGTLRHLGYESWNCSQIGVGCRDGEDRQRSLQIAKFCDRTAITTENHNGDCWSETWKETTQDQLTFSAASSSTKNSTRGHTPYSTSTFLLYKRLKVNFEHMQNAWISTAALHYFWQAHLASLVLRLPQCRAARRTYWRVKDFACHGNPRSMQGCAPNSPNCIIILLLLCGKV